jgi:transcriptional regulator with XRE-family HTH domain
MPLEALRSARLAAGFTYREVAQAADLDPSTLCHCELGRARPSPRALERWRSALKDLVAARAAAITEALTRF